jgi:hypothetical protein
MLWGEKTSKGMKNDSLSFPALSLFYSAVLCAFSFVLWIIIFLVYFVANLHTRSIQIGDYTSRFNIKSLSFRSLSLPSSIDLSAKKHIYYRKFCASAQRRFTPKDFVDSAPSWRIFHATFAFLLLKSQSMPLHSILIAKLWLYRNI